MNDPCRGDHDGMGDGHEPDGPGVIGNVRQLGEKSYLGDGVYARVDEVNAIILTTENGSVEPTNLIVLEPDVMAALTAWYKREMSCATGDCDEHPQYNRP